MIFLSLSTCMRVLLCVAECVCSLFSTHHGVHCVPKKRGAKLLQQLHQLLTNFEFFSLLETEINYLQNKYTFYCFLKTLLYKGLKCCNCSTTRWWQSCQLHIEKNYVNTLKTCYFTYLFTALTSRACTSHGFTTVRKCWTFGTALNREQCRAQMTSGECITAPAYGPKEDMIALKIS